MCLAGWPELVSRTDAETRSRVGKSQWVFRLSLCLVDFTAMVFRHVLLAASFFGAAGNELGQQILASSIEVCIFWQLAAPDPSNPFRSTLNTGYIRFGHV